MTDTLDALREAVQVARNYYMLFHDKEWEARLTRWEAALDQAKGQICADRQCEFCQTPESDPPSMLDVCPACWNRANEGSGWMQRALKAEAKGQTETVTSCDYHARYFAGVILRCSACAKVNAVPASHEGSQG